MFINTVSKIPPDSPQLSIVIPAYNEAESLPVLLEQIQVVLKTHAYHRAEVIIINDGSTDATAEVLDVLSAQPQQPPIRVIHFRRNQGKAEALMAGFAAATGYIVITMDADLQDDPGEIPKLLDTLNTENYDVVSGWKYPRKDPLEKRVFSFFFNRITAFFTGVKLHDINCGFKAYRAEVVKELHLYGDLHRYIPILAHQAGYKVGEVKVKHHPRRFGVSKYGFKRIPKGFFDLFTVLFLTKYLKRPLHVFGTIGAVVAFIGVLIGLYLAVLWVIEDGVGFRPLLMLSVLMIILGIQFFSIGLLGELVIGLISRLERRVIGKKTDAERTPRPSANTEKP
ncbi:glycosyltransferase family 2 protein [Candidatus Poribacteria bacterium]|nr:glycosyltransferase family 2 protein [Candidatus Poribacteria bacterium]MYK25247.1 glycosyltransferase family 2 protein [Candidatus Poribacteria bacterium]